MCKDYKYEVSNNTDPIWAEIKVPADIPYCGDLDPQDGDLVRECPPSNSRCFTLFEDMT